MSYLCASYPNLATAGHTPDLRILVVEDDHSSHHLHGILAEGQPTQEIDMAFQAQEGVRMVQQALAERHPYAVAFLNLGGMSDGERIEYAKQIWETSPDLQIVLAVGGTGSFEVEVDEGKGAEYLSRLFFLRMPAEKIEIVQLAEVLTEKWKHLQESKSKVDDLERMVHERTKDLEASHAAALKAMEEALRNHQEMERAYEELKRGEEERRKLEEQYREQSAQLLRAQRMESVGTLASGIAHDMNNILAPILLSVFMLRRPQPPEEFEKTLLNIETNTKRGADLVKQLLIFGRGASGKREVVRLNTLFKDLEKLIQGTFPKSLALVSEIARDMWPVMGDGTQLHQVLLNLCVNARDAMPNGGKITLGARNVQFDENYAAMHAEAKPGPYLCLCVADNGSGIPPEVIDKIFDPFFTTKEVGSGTGLGLSTVMGIVKGHNGFVRLRSQVGVGTTFEIYLPAVPDAVESAAAAPSPALLRGHGEKILVVDDEEGIRDVLQKTLRQHGYEVLAAGDGIEAIVQYSQHRNEIKAVLTDLMMPSMDGVTMTKALKRMDPDIKIIASSGIGSARDKDEKAAELSALGVTTFLSKPYTAGEILAAISGLLRQEPQAVAV
jgi:signal transduction histidine kinase